HHGLMPKPTRRGGGRPRSQSTHDNATNPNPSQPFSRQPTLYDAIAGRISTTGFIPPHRLPSNTRDTTRTSLVPLPPEEVLFRRRNAPERYEEDDIYWAHENLPPSHILPDSDLLKAVHAYASDFYGKALGEKGEGKVSFGSMDETALMAFGVLLEEEVGRLVEGTGDLVFVEGGKRDDGDGVGRRRSKGKGKGKGREEGSREAGKEQRRASVEGFEEEDESGMADDDESSVIESSQSERPSKRRRIEREESEPESLSVESESGSETDTSGSGVS
ncbi:MAG: hypothetical protein LQ338_008088, partial [Usnochroma carphineum]